MIGICSKIPFNTVNRITTASTDIPGMCIIATVGTTTTAFPRVFQIAAPDYKNFLTAFVYE